MSLEIIPSLALQRDKRLARRLYPVSQALAAQVVQACSKVTCRSVADAAALLASPRWAGARPVTGLVLHTS
jgi:hypothetical protein